MRRTKKRERRLMRLLSIGATALPLFIVGCGSITVPVAVVGDQGFILRGTATAAFSGEGTFSVAGRGLTCAGNYNSLNPSPTIQMPVTCSDGRKGIIIATRNPDGLSGSGRVRLEDGTEADFIFGKAAEAF